MAGPATFELTTSAFGGRRPLERLACLRPVLVAQREARPLGVARIAHPDLAVRMQAAAARGGHGGAAGAMEQAGIGRPAVGVDAAIAGDDLLPRRLAPGEGGRVGERQAV